MQTNFFRQLANMNLTGDLQITLRPTTDNSFVLSVLLNNEQCGDEARKLIPPLNLRGTAEELDNGFFESISTPLQTASGLMVDMENFMKQLEETKKKSAMEKEKQDKEKKEKVFVLGALPVFSQVDSLKIGLDFRTRAELDNGQKTLIAEGKSAENTVVSRARLNMDYFYQNLQLYFSIQDARTWGENASTASKNQNFVLNEAWAKYQFTPKAALKIGRQMLTYDDERLIGGLDWAMQGRSFDAAKGIFNFNKNSKLEVAITYNNDDNDANDSAENEIYDIVDGGEKAKSLQIFHYQFQNANKFQFSSIALNSVVQNTASGTHYNMFTLGVNAKKYFENFGFFGSVYYQSGKNTNAQSKSAYQFSINADFIISNKFEAVLGTEWLSGRDYDTPNTENKSFSPFYGTNHKFNRYMDYFFVGNHFNSYGLNDYYLKTTTKFNPKSSFMVNLHAFTTNGKLANDQSSYLGTETDMVFAYKFSKMFVMNVGHSFMFASNSMEILKVVNTPKNLQTWSWIQLNFVPSFRLK